MKKSIKKLLIVITAIVFTSNVSALSNGTVDKDNYQDFLKRNWELVQLSTKLQDKIKEYYNIEKTYEDRYPEYYGGIYFNDNATALIIQIVKENIPEISSNEYKIYDEIISMDKHIEIEYVDNSFNELNSINNNVSDYISLKDKVNANIIGTYIDVMNNSITVELKENNYEEQLKLKKNIIMGKNNIKNKLLIESNIIKFEEAGIVENSSKINPGGAAYSGANCTTGVRIYYKGNAYLTAGHCVQGLAETANGVVGPYQYYDNQYYDYAVIRITDNQLEITNKLEKTSSDGLITKLAVVDYCPSITTNMEIAKVAKETGYTSGKVTGLNKTTKIDEDGYTIKGLVKSNLKSNKGDSGGPVFIPKIDALGGAVPIGIVNSRENTIFGIQTAMYFTSIANLPTELQNRY